jgi:uncharacterized protein YrrD
MNPKQLAVLAATALALAPLALAAQQSSEVTAYQEAEDDDMVVQPFNRTVDDIEDLDLKNADGDEIGEVEEVLIDASGEPVAIAVEVGGFLGIGERDVVLGLDQVQLVDDDLVTSADKATIEGLPDWPD